LEPVEELGGVSQCHIPACLLRVRVATDLGRMARVAGITLMFEESNMDVVTLANLMPQRRASIHLATIVRLDSRRGS
jgi:hypothetical protein